VSPTEIQEAKEWFVTSWATRDRLEKDGFLLSGDDCTAVVQNRQKDFENTIYDMESMATATYYFPSLDCYIHYLCMLEGFRKMTEPQLKPGPGGEIAQALRDQFDRANKVMGLGQVDVEVMLIAAFYALLGRNGAGKSSLVRCALGQQKPGAGQVRLFGEDVWRKRAHLMKRVGVLPEEPDAPPSMTAGALATFAASL
jgi:hypothetical protein